MLRMCALAMVVCVSCVARCAFVYTVVFMMLMVVLMIVPDVVVIVVVVMMLVIVVDVAVTVRDHGCC